MKKEELTSKDGDEFIAKWAVVCVVVIVLTLICSALFGCAAPKRPPTTRAERIEQLHSLGGWDYGSFATKQGE